jgi:hypothetical protein
MIAPHVAGAGLLVVVAALSAAGARAAAPSAPDPLFAAESVVNITLTGPFRSMSRDRSPEPEYSDGTLGYVDAAGVSRQFDIRMRPRGNSRRDRNVCTFPPLRLNFEKKAVKGSLFDEQNILKLVTHCRHNENFQDYVLKEYLGYRMFNLLSEVSFRVRLLKVTYVDSEQNRKSFERYGFFIEHKDRLAARLGTEVAEPVRIGTDQLEPRQASIAELFEFLISNTDYSFIAGPPDESCCHNAVLLVGEEGTYLPVPYDLDRSGLVDPPNGEPAEELGQRNLKDRLYRGFCRDPRYLEAALEKTREERGPMEALFESQPDLSKRDRDDAVRFIESYYSIIDDERRRDRELKCRGPM